MSATETIQASSPPPSGWVPEVSPGGDGAPLPATYPFSPFSPAVEAEIVSRARADGFYSCRGAVYRRGVVILDVRMRYGQLSARELQFICAAAKRGKLNGRLLRVDRVHPKPVIVADGSIVAAGFRRMDDGTIIAVHAPDYLPFANRRPSPLDAGTTMFSDRASAATFYAATAYLIAPGLFETPPALQVVGDRAELAVALLFATARGSAPPQAIDTSVPHEEHADEGVLVLEDLDVTAISSDWLQGRLVINLVPESEPQANEIRLRPDFAPSARVAAAALEVALDQHPQSFMTIAGHVSALVRRVRAPISWVDAIEWFGRQIA